MMRKIARSGNRGNWQVTGLILVGLLLQDCATLGGKKGEGGPASSKTPAVKVEESGDISDLAKAVKTPDDAAILDLLLGYRMLLLRNPDPKSLDKETLKKSRAAYDRLETALRHGGLKPQEPGERVYTITNEDKLSLQEVIKSASQAADKDARGGDWDKARARWKEIASSKPAVNLAMEEAQWGLTLSDALQSTLPDTLKKKLKDVNESYAADISHDEIGRQVKTLLEQIPDIKIQRELKKLANRAWERDKKAGRLTSVSMAQTVPPDVSADNGKDGAGGAANTGSAPGSATSSGAGAPGGSPTGAASGPAGTGASSLSPESNALAAQSDTLASQGKYLAALKILDSAGDQAWVKDKKNQIGDRFCEEKRKAAANTFKDFKKATVDSARRTLLKKTASELDSCLFYFPDVSVSPKVRKNRDMVDGEMKKLK